MNSHLKQSSGSLLFSVSLVLTVEVPKKIWAFSPAPWMDGGAYRNIYVLVQ